MSLATYRIFAEYGLDKRVVLSSWSRSDLVIALDDLDDAGEVAHVVAATLRWENDHSIEITGCDCAGEHQWDVD